MFIVYKNKEKKPKSNLNKKNIFTQINSSPKKIKEKLTSSNINSSFITNNSIDSGKGLTNFLQSDQNALNTTQKNEFLSKKIKFHIDKIGIEKEESNNIFKGMDSTEGKKKKKRKIIIQSTEEDVNEGRWDTNEHMRFLEAINIFGNEWKEVKKYIGTRSSNQVRSHAQKFFLKLKTFKDPSLGVDFTGDSIKNFSTVINIIKEAKKEINCPNILSVLNQKLSERNIKINNDSINNNKSEDVIVNDNKIIINNESINKNDYNRTFKEFIVKNPSKKIFKSKSFNKKEKKIVKFCKIKSNKNNKLKEKIGANINKNNKIIEENNKTKEISINKKSNEERYFDYENYYNNILDEYIYDNSNKFDYEANDNYLFSVSNCMKEINTISLINRDYYC